MHKVNNLNPLLSSVILSSSEVFEKSKGGPLHLWMHFRSWANSVQILDKFFPEKLHSAEEKRKRNPLASSKLSNIKKTLIKHGFEPMYTCFPAFHQGEANALTTKPQGKHFNFPPTNNGGGKS